MVVATDAVADPAGISLSVTVRSDEPDNANGVGDGDTTGDVAGQDGFSTAVDVGGLFVFDAAVLPYGAWVATVELRAERDGTEDGRCYTIDIVATDGQLNASSSSCCIVVPHDRRGQ